MREERGGIDRQESFAYGINYHSEERGKESVYCFLRLMSVYALRLLLPRSLIRCRSFGDNLPAAKKQRWNLFAFHSLTSRFPDLLTAALTAHAESVVSCQ